MRPLLDLPPNEGFGCSPRRVRERRRSDRKRSRRSPSARSRVARVQRICFTLGVSVAGRRISDPGEGTIARTAAEREPLEQLIRAHSAYVARLAYRVLGGDDEVNDLVQDVFLAFLRFRGTIREAGAVRGWLGTTTVRLSLRRLRSRRRRFRFFVLSEHDKLADAPASDSSPEEHAIFRSIHAALEQVPVEARVAWVLRHLEQEPLADVAQLSGCSLATAKRRIALAHVAVKRALSDD